MEVRFNGEMSCQIRQLNSDVSDRRGKYLDLKTYPDRAGELPEARIWPAVGAFIGDVNRINSFQTFGCTAEGVTPGGHEAPFVDIAFAAPPTNVLYCMRRVGGTNREFRKSRSSSWLRPGNVRRRCNIP